MSLARLVVTAVRTEERTKAEVARDYGLAPRWVYELCRRFDAEGEQGLEPRSRRPHWSLVGGTEVEILDVIDDHSRFLVASVARRVFKAADVVACFHEAASAHGLPASLLTDNGAVFTAVPRKGLCAIELETARLGIR